MKALSKGGMQQSSCSAEQRPPEGARTAPRTPRPCSTAGAVRLHLVALLPFGSVPAAPLLGTRIHCCPAVPPYLKRERDCADGSGAVTSQQRHRGEVMEKGRVLVAGFPSPPSKNDSVQMGGSKWIKPTAEQPRFFQERIQQQPVI